MHHEGHEGTKKKAGKQSGIFASLRVFVSFVVKDF